MNPHNMVLKTIPPEKLYDILSGDEKWFVFKMSYH